MYVVVTSPSIHLQIWQRHTNCVSYSLKQKVKIKHLQDDLILKYQCFTLALNYVTILTEATGLTNAVVTSRDVTLSNHRWLIIILKVKIAFKYFLNTIKLSLFFIRLLFYDSTILHYLQYQ